MQQRRNKGSSISYNKHHKEVTRGKRNIRESKKNKKKEGGRGTRGGGCTHPCSCSKDLHVARAPIIIIILLTEGKRKQRSQKLFINQTNKRQRKGKEGE